MLAGLGGSRLARLQAGIPRVVGRKTGHIGSRAYAEDVYIAMKEYILSVPAEPGYPCQHREFVSQTNNHGAPMSFANLYAHFMEFQVHPGDEDTDGRTLPT